MNGMPYVLYEGGRVGSNSGYWLHIDPEAVIKGRPCYGPFQSVEAAREACAELVDEGFVNLTDDVRDFLEDETPQLMQKAHPVRTG